MSEIVENPHVALNNACTDGYRAASRPTMRQKNRYVVSNKDFVEDFDIMDSDGRKIATVKGTTDMGFRAELEAQKIVIELNRLAARIIQ